MTPLFAVALFTLFTAVFAATGLLSWQLLENHNPVRRRLRQLSQSGGQGGTVTSLLINEPTSAVRRLARWIPTSPAKIRKVGPRLTAMGYQGTSAVVVFSALQVLSAAAGALLVIVILGTSWWRVALLAGVVGFLVPGILLRRAFSRRQREIQNGLPDALDLCVICVEAGCSLDHAIAKTTEQLALTYPALAAELNLVRAETRAGKPKIEAFKNFADRTQIDEVRSLVSMLVQTERFGTSIAQALRVHAASARARRRQRAEERAAKSGIKLVFPLVLFLFPAFYVVILGPAVLQVARTLANVNP